MNSFIAFMYLPMHLIYLIATRILPSPDWRLEGMEDWGKGRLGWKMGAWGLDNWSLGVQKWSLGPPKWFKN